MQIVARVLLELREGEGLAAVDNAGHVGGALLGGRAMAQEAAADHHRGEIGLQHQRAAERLHHDHGFHATAAEAAVLFRERQAEQALLGELAPDGLAPAALLLHVFLALLEIIGVGQETVDALLEKALLLRQIEIHFFYSPGIQLLVMPALVAGIHALLCVQTWMAGSSPAMTTCVWPRLVQTR